ncbi:hypothetical protein OJAV_G00117350 [Oryzias javanicus]|uniref:GOLD domain-containing protein n=1 Tax=Oryzias javanicus TaxID=123683 RepID=A0A3S2P327_ORYJA|nr:hypothetical protein OJAV_G00117350 [Oryzias javanicus]
MQVEIPFFLSVCVFWGSVNCGPQMSPHLNTPDQERFWGADQYDFSVVLPSAGTECFWHFAHYGETFYLSFMVQWVTGIGNAQHLTVTVNAPGGLLVSTVDDAKGQVNFKASETGFYQMCFSNFHNRLSTMQIFLSFGVYYDDQNPSNPEKEREELDKDLNNTLSVIEGSTHRVKNFVFHMFRYYAFGRMKKSSDYYRLHSNSKYMTWWSVALSLLIVTSGYLQLRFLKSLFVSRSEDTKPC